jgi:hypothetical protein
MYKGKIVKIDGILWLITANNWNYVEPLCPKHRIKMYGSGEGMYSNLLLKCMDCEKLYPIPRHIREEKQYVIDKINSIELRSLQVLNLDDEAVPIAKTKTSSKDNKYFITANIMESRVGKRLVIYVGEKGRKDKTQIFVEPEIKRLAFDQADKHPSEIFIKLEATFEDGSRSFIVSGDRPKNS